MSSFPDTIVIRDPWTGELRTVVVPPVQTFDAPRPCICEGSSRVLIDDDAEVPCPHCSEGQGEGA